MNKDRLIQNVIDQIKEGQLKLGYARETVRLYYPLSSLNAILGTDFKDISQALDALKEINVGYVEVGKLGFSQHEDRIEISVSPEGVEYVHEEVGEPAFLADMIKLFSTKHACTIEDVKEIFKRYSKNFTCKKMTGEDFDYVLYFDDPSIDEYYYCIKSEMGHSIYHRFSKEDYKLLWA
ncbi:protein of unknown function [Acetitomaculum ruminis DSM 5522]|uniref:Uncharacterized protein n=1 Tax=Acetitomaculum ruminis DSM 5522 TaxID=1120918 RepID=A0A1I0YBD7_9FIRM|nr:DUF3877 family protein [Acetitomaculum ruminis]SFB10107.1 protein of unknown function [Acetitomaculum ruminis DSM 5522]